jgi:hypothetical protein
VSDARTRRWAPLALLLLLPLAGTLAAGEDREDPVPPPTPTHEAALAAVARGVSFLVTTQTADGSWGTPAPNLFLDIYSPIPSAHDAYRVAVTGLAVSALVEVGGEREGVAEAVRRGSEWLVAHHAKARRAQADVLYNTWAHVYALEAFARLLGVEKDDARREALRAAAKEAVDLLVRYEYVDGGWGYYDFSIGTRTPATGYSTSFTTASALVALRLAADRGVEVPERIVKRAKDSIRAVAFPSGSYAYSFSHRYNARGGINKIQGSLARTPACHVALLLWGEPMPESRVVDAFENLEKHGHFLRIARKYPIPHETWYQNSGYFCFYGYYYAALLSDRLPAERRTFHRGRIAAHLLPLQEEDGSWWDYQLYGFHKAYGTGYVLLALGRALADLPAGG